MMLALAALDFLGLGIQPPDSSWGLMLAQGREFYTSAWWLVTFPGLSIMLTALIQPAATPAMIANSIWRNPRITQSDTLSGVARSTELQKSNRNFFFSFLSP